jgi:hypothetical protein
VDPGASDQRATTEIRSNQLNRYRRYSPSNFKSTAKIRLALIARAKGYEALWTVGSRSMTKI